METLTNRRVSVVQTLGIILVLFGGTGYFVWWFKFGNTMEIWQMTASLIALMIGAYLIYSAVDTRQQLATEAKKVADRESRLAGLRQDEIEADKLVGQIFAVVEVGKWREALDGEGKPYCIGGTLTVSDGVNNCVWEVGERLWRGLAQVIAGDQLQVVKRQRGEYYSPEKVDERLQSEREFRQIKGLATRSDPIDPRFYFLAFKRVK